MTSFLKLKRNIKKKKKHPPQKKKKKKKKSINKNNIKKKTRRKKEAFELRVKIAINDAIKINIKWNFAKYFLFLKTSKKAVTTRIKPTGPKNSPKNLG